MYVLDTDIYSLFRRGNPRVVEQVSKVPAPELYITIVTRVEVLSGRFQQLRTAASAQELLMAQDHLDDADAHLLSMQVLPVDNHSARAFESLLGLKIGKLHRNDLLIASITLSRGFTLAHETLVISRKCPTCASRTGPGRDDSDRTCGIVGGLDEIAGT